MPSPDRGLFFASFLLSEPGARQPGLTVGAKFAGPAASRLRTKRALPPNRVTLAAAAPARLRFARPTAAHAIGAAQAGRAARTSAIAFARQAALGDPSFWR